MELETREKWIQWNKIWVDPTWTRTSVVVITLDILLSETLRNFWKVSQNNESVQTLNDHKHSQLVKLGQQYNSAKVEQNNLLVEKFTTTINWNTNNKFDNDYLT